MMTPHWSTTRVPAAKTIPFTAGQRYDIEILHDGTPATPIWTTVVCRLTAAFPAACYIGLAVASGSNTTLNSSQFSNVSVTP